MRVLVTGGAGFIGRNLVERLQGQAEIVVIDNFRSGFRQNLRGLDCDLRIGSILDRDLVRTAMHGVEYVFHLAALVSVLESVQKPDECIEINSRGTLIVLEEAARANVRKFIFSSSAAVYGSNYRMPCREDDAPSPQSPYAATKLEGEMSCKTFTDSDQLRTACLRYFNVYGPYQNPASQYAAAVPIFIRRAVANKPIVIYGDGKQTRDFVYAKEVVSSNLFFALESSATGVFNVGSGEETSIDQLALTICELTKSQSKIEYAEERPGDVKYSRAAIDKLRSAGFRVQSALAAGLKETIEIYREVLAAAS